MKQDVVKDQHQEIICPWCYNLNSVLKDVEVFQCKVCNRVVTEEDLIQEELKEK